MSVLRATFAPMLHEDPCARILRRALTHGAVFGGNMKRTPFRVLLGRILMGLLIVIGFAAVAVAQSDTGHDRIGDKSQDQDRRGAAQVGPDDEGGQAERSPARRLVINPEKTDRPQGDKNPGDGDNVCDVDQTVRLRCRGCWSGPTLR